MKETTAEANQINITVEKGIKELVIRQGQALELKEPEKVSITGVLDSPLKWLKSRIELIDQKKANIIVNREGLAICLTTDENNPYGTDVTGCLKFTEIFNEFGINTKKQNTPGAMGDFIKMNRSFFESREIAAKLVSELKNFKAKVNQLMEKNSDNRGNEKLLRQQVVESNLPESFHITIPVFKGQPKKLIEVEIWIDPETYACMLMSPVVNDIVHTEVDQLIDEQIKSIRSVAPGIVIIEV